MPCDHRRAPRAGSWNEALSSTPSTDFALGTDRGVGPTYDASTRDTWQRVKEKRERNFPAQCAWEAARFSPWFGLYLCAIPRCRPQHQHAAQGQRRKPWSAIASNDFMHTGPRAWSDKLLSRPVAFLHIHCLSHSPAVTRRPYSFVGVHFFLHDVKARAAGADDIVRIQLFVAHVGAHTRVISLGTEQCADAWAGHVSLAAGDAPALRRRREKARARAQARVGICTQQGHTVPEPNASPDSVPQPYVWFRLWRPPRGTRP